MHCFTDFKCRTTKRLVSGGAKGHRHRMGPEKVKPRLKPLQALTLSHWTHSLAQTIYLLHRHTCMSYMAWVPVSIRAGLGRYRKLSSVIQALENYSITSQLRDTKIDLILI